MTLYEYKQLEEITQALILLDKGMHLGERSNSEHNIFL